MLCLKASAEHAVARKLSRTPSTHAGSHLDYLGTSNKKQIAQRPPGCGTARRIEPAEGTGEICGLLGQDGPVSQEAQAFCGVRLKPFDRPDLPNAHSEARIQI